MRPRSRRPYSSCLNPHTPTHVHPGGNRVCVTRCHGLARGVLATDVLCLGKALWRAPYACAHVACKQPPNCQPADDTGRQFVHASGLPSWADVVICVAISTATCSESKVRLGDERAGDAVAAAITGCHAAALCGCLGPHPCRCGVLYGPPSSSRRAVPCRMRPCSAPAATPICPAQRVSEASAVPRAYRSHAQVPAQHGRGGRELPEALPGTQGALGAVARRVNMIWCLLHSQRR